MKDVNVSNITSVEGGNVVQGDVESNIVSNLNDNDKSNKTQSFASIVKDNLMSNFKFPERDQAILFDTIENTQKNDYIVSVGELIGPKAILFDTIENTQKNDYIVSDKFITARRLVSPAKRVILSNVSPCIPHKVVEEHLKRAGLDVVSAITFVSAGVHNPEYKHIYSFRRQAYINLEQNNELPHTLIINFELPHTLIINFNQFAFRIFLSTDEIKCFICKKSGHLAKKCPNYTGGRDIITIAEVHPQPNNADKAEAVIEEKDKAEAVTEGTIVASNNMTEITTTSVEKSLITQCSNLEDFVASKKRPASPASELDKISVVEDESGSSGTVHWVEPRTKKKRKNSNSKTTVMILICSKNFEIILTKVTRKLITRPFWNAQSVVAKNVNIIYPARRWKIDKNKVTVYTDYLRKTHPNIPNLPTAKEKIKFCLQNIRQAAVKFCLQNIRQAADSVFTIKKAFITKNSIRPWWDAECTEVIKKRKQALRNFNTSRTLENYLEHRQVSAYSKRFLKYKKRNSWKAFCNNLSKDTPISEVWNKIRNFKQPFTRTNNLSKDTPISEVWNKIRNFKQPFTRTSSLSENQAYAFLTNLTPDSVTAKKPAMCVKPLS
ncbi:Zinc knuckle [Popillia japonica]|uniref:Zinc knuckle n=1 Tax=Popillia japonica TaxID=7064 RepID=A0AAW1MH50_POPJA